MIDSIFEGPVKKLINLINRYEMLSLLCLVYLIYNINGRTLGSGDTIPASLLPFSILENHNLYLDQFYYYYVNNYDQTWYFREMNGHFLSSYPIVTPILITMFYIIPYLFIKLCNIHVDMYYPAFSLTVLVMEKLSASLIASVSVIFVYLSLKEFTNRRTAFIVAIVFAFATNTWTVSSQALWQHGLVELFLAMSIFLVLLNEEQRFDRIVIFLGILSGLSLFNRPIDSILLIPIIYYIFQLRDKRIVYYILAVILSGAPFLFYNLYYFGSFFGGYNNLLSWFDVSSEMINRFAGLLISPSRGLFIYTPIMLLSILGYFKIFKMPNNRVKNFLLVLGISSLVMVVVYSAFKVWWAGGSYGPRFLTGMLPALAIFLGLFIKDIKLNIGGKNILIICIICLLLTWSIFVQFIGAFYYPNGNWDGNPNVDYHPEKLWDWSDTQITRTFNAGMSSPNNFLSIRKIIDPTRLKDISEYEILQANGWHGLESWNDIPCRWMLSDATFVVFSPDNRAANLSLRALSFFRPRTLAIYVGEELAAQVAVPSTNSINVTAPVILAEGMNTMRLHVPEGCERPCDIKELNNPDSRCLSIAVQNITVGL